MQEYKTNFRVSSALKNLIGKELITNNYVAVYELVKNAFDANSTNIEVIFDLYDNKIIISDNGTGMNYLDIVNKWLFIGYSEKRGETDKKLSGNKGIGRFSCDRLGKELVLTSFKDGEKSVLSINWDDFEINQTEEIQNREIIVFREKTEQKNGTTICIKQLRDEWLLKDVRGSEKQLLHLISPSIHEQKQKLYLTVIDAEGNKETKLLKNDVFDYMNVKTIFVESIFDDKTIKTTLHDKGNVIFENVSKNHSLIKNAEMKVFFADKYSKTIFKKRTGIEIVNYGSVYIYRNGFRIFPYGEPGYDLFDLDKRKAQGHFRYLGTREIFGWIDIEDKHNNFVESTSRDKGFIENIYYDSLKNVYLEYVQKPLEKYAELMSFGVIRMDDYAEEGVISVVSDSISNKFRFKDSISFNIDNSINEMASDAKIRQLEVDGLSTEEKKQIIKTVQSNIKMQQKVVESQEKEIHKEREKNAKLIKEIDIKNAFIDASNPARQEMLEHDLGLVIDKLYDVLDYLLSLKSQLSSPNKSLLSSIENIGWSIFRVKGIRKAVLKTNISTLSNSKINVGNFYDEYKNRLVDGDGIKIAIHKNGTFILLTNIFDLITIFDNIFTNVKGMGGKKLDVYIYDDRIQFVSDTFSEDAKIDFSRVFDLGYSTRDGTGIGMYMIKSICVEYKLKVLFYRIDNSKLICTEICKNA